MSSSTSPEVQIAPGLSIPIDVATEAIAILGRRGKGKTSTAVVLVEELVGLGVPVCVVDTVGVWWGLRSSTSGKRPGLPIVVFGGSHGDVPLTEASGSIIARVVVDQRIPSVVDTSHLSKGAARRFLTDFVTEIYHRNRSPLHMVFDEADELAPQNPRAEGARLLGAMEDLVRRGRARGIGVTLVTQRPAVLNKDVLTQIEVLITHGMTGPRDIAAIDEWVRHHADEEEARQVRSTLASLPTGTAWVWSPSWLELLKRVQIRARRTFDSSATPKVGRARIDPISRAKVDLNKLGAEIAAAIEQAQEDDPKSLRARIAQLERERSASPRPQTIEVPVLDEPDRQQLEKAILALDELTSALRGVDALRDSVQTAITTVREIDTKTRAARTPQPVPISATPSAAPRTPPATPDQDLPTASTLGLAERKILTVLATYGARTHQQLALQAGYSAKGGGFQNALGKLRSAGRIIGGRDHIEITEQGSKDLGPFAPLPSGHALVDHWLATLGKAERLILSSLVSAWPATLTREEIAEQTGYAPGGGGFQNALGKLRTLGLIHGDRNATAAVRELGESANVR